MYDFYHEPRDTSSRHSNICLNFLEIFGRFVPTLNLGSDIQAISLDFAGFAGNQRPAERMEPPWLLE